jgi:uncharacterized protein with FMN-binding domain
MDTKNRIFTVVGAVALIATVGLGGYTLFATKDTTATSQASTSSQVAATPVTTAQATTASATTESSGTTASSSTSYKDGTYTASTTYSVPKGGQNSLSATVTISGGKITTVKTTDNYADHESGSWISDFESEVSSDASGQSIASYSPSRIGGASLTTDAFDDALTTIKSQASA